MPGCHRSVVLQVAPMNRDLWFTSRDVVIALFFFPFWSLFVRGLYGFCAAQCIGRDARHLRQRDRAAAAALRQQQAAAVVAPKQPVDKVADVENQRQSQELGSLSSGSIPRDSHEILVAGADIDDEM